MTTKRTYDDGCPAAHALDVVGERWALLVVRELLFGAKRFTDLRAGLPGASPNVLSQRLRELDEAGVLRRRRLPPPAAAWVYELTPWGQELEPVIAKLAVWGEGSPARHGGPISVDSLMLAVKTLYDPARTGGPAADLVVRIGEDAFRVAVAPGGLRVAREPVDRPDASIRTDTATLDDLMRGRRPLDDARADGDLVLDGDPGVVARFLALYHAPSA